MSITFYLVACLVCIALSAFFSGSEMSLSSANRMRLENMAEDGNRSAALAVKVIDRFDNTLSAILIGNNFVNIALSSISSVIAIVFFAEEFTWIATVICTVLVIIFGETMPKIVAKKNANRLATVVAWPVRFLSIVLFPLIFIVVGIVHLVTLPLKGEKEDEDSDAAVEELQSMIETAEEEDVLDEDQSELLQAALDFNDTSVSEVMTARVDMEAIDIEDDPEEIYAYLAETDWSRIPVYEGSIDNIIGVLRLNRYLKALMDEPRPDIRSLLIKPCYIYKTTKLPNVLEQLRRAKLHLAIVTDEYGGCTGIVTMEDVLERIVGEIWDDTDEIEAEEVIERPDGLWELDGDMAISDFIELMDYSEDSFETESSTVGGWTLETFGSYPEEGQSFTYENLTVTVLKMDGMRVERVLIKREEKDEEDE
ncbi:MAG: HlyC/CorC family transporter [Oscillospiraceae bacterium]|nr:HlyC/CorC family transporter [Oscillospiraceae bacterium]